VLVHHYIEGTNTPVPLIDETPAQDELIKGKVDDEYTTKALTNIPEFYEVINATPEKANGSMTVDLIVVTYEYRLRKYDYVVNYLEKDTNQVLSIQKQGDENNWGTSITEQAIDIDGYNKVDPVEQTITIDIEENIINFYYTKKNDLEYTVNYLEKGTDKVIAKQKVVQGMTLEEEVLAANEVMKIKGYNYDSVDKDKIVITTGINVINIYYTKKDAKVIIHYYEEGTENKVAEDNQILGKVFDEYKTKESDNIASKYELIATPTNNEGEMTEEDIVVIYYYRKKATQVIVHHYEEKTINKLSEDVIIYGRVDDSYTTAIAEDIPIKYEFVNVVGNVTGTMTEETIEITYFYKIKDSKVIVKYIDKNTGKELANEETQNGKVDEKYITDAKTIKNYTLVEDSGNTTGRLTIDPTTVIFYYLQNTKVIVNYVDKETGELLDTLTQNGLVGDEFESTSKDFQLYILLEKPIEEKVTMRAEEIVLTYYYKKIDAAGIIEKHIDIYTGEILSNTTHTGKIEDEYEIQARTFIGYDLVEDRLPTNAKGVMKEDELIEVVYYYSYISRVTAKYIDRATGKELESTEIIDGHEGDGYITERKAIDDYVLTEIPENADGTMTKEPTGVIYIYAHVTGGVIERHIDITTGKQLVVEEKFEGYEGDNYKTEPENIPYYDIVTEKYPANSEGKMTIEPIIVNYYYIEQTKVTVKYVDVITGEEIIEAEVTEGHIGDSYKSTEKEIKGYDLIEEPINKTGRMTDEPIEVVYKYVRPARLVIKHIDVDTKEEIVESETIRGHEGDNYTSVPKEMQYYKLVEDKIPSNAKGHMEVKVIKNDDGTEIVDNITIVDYYYRKLKFNLSIEKIIDTITVNGETRTINNNIGKIELNKNNIDENTVQISYKIKVTNNGELAGAAKLLENIPEGTTMLSEENTEWEIIGSKATIKTDKIEVGETKTYTVVINWTSGANNLGNKPNTVQIIETENEAGYEETSTKDNSGQANLIISINTGEKTYILVTGLALIVLVGISIVLVKKYYLK